MSVLLYDPDCGFCTASANLLRRLEPRARILPGTPENLVQYRVDTRRFAHALPFINDAGQIIYGSDAIALTLRTCPDATLRGKFLRAAGVLLLNPPMRPVAHRAYRLVAGHRAQISRLTSRLGCTSLCMWKSIWYTRWVQYE